MYSSTLYNNFYYGSKRVNLKEFKILCLVLFMFLVKYNEIFLKSEKVRKKMLYALTRNIRSKGGEVILLSDSLLAEATPKILKKTFGIHSFAEVTECEKEMKEIEKESVKMSEKFTGSFKISANRSDKSFGKTSKEIEEIVGEAIVKTGKKVDLSSPDNILYIEIKDKCYLHSSLEKGPGGLPYGVSGKMVSFGNKIERIWLMMKRGVEPVFIKEVPSSLLDWIPGSPLVVNQPDEVKEEITGTIGGKIEGFPSYDPLFFLTKEEAKEINKIIS